MDKTVILAVAGAGKTYHICHNIDTNKRNLILAYTNRNINNIERELNDVKKKSKYTKVLTFHKFLYNFFIRPFEISIGEFFGEEIKSKGLILDEAIKPIDSNGNYNKNYKRKKMLGHYMINNRYYSSNLPELILYLKDKSDVFERAMKNINNYFDYLYIDEFQDFREENYKLVEEIIKKCNNITLVGDYYQHSVNGKTKSGVPFEKKKFNITNRKYETVSISYSEFKSNLINIGLNIDEETLKKSRRCSKEVCNFVREHLDINFESVEINSGNVKIVDNISEGKDILENNEIKKLVYNAPYKWNFNCDSWSYCKGDTFKNVCVILTSNLEKLIDDKFDISSVSSKTINMLYVALTRTKGNLHIISNQLFKEINEDYKV